MSEVEAHFKTLPPQIQEFDHFKPAEFLFQRVEVGRKLPGFETALSAFQKLIGSLNSLLK